MENSENQAAWLCLRFSHLPLNSLGVHAKQQNNYAVYEQEKLLAYTDYAGLSGMKLGMSTSHALMINPELCLTERMPSKEAAKLKQLSHWAYRFTSQVSISNNHIRNNHSLLLEIGKSINLFKSLDHLINLISNDLDCFKLDYAIGLGQTPKAAHALSFPPANTLSKPKLSDLVQTKRLSAVKLCHLQLDSKVIQRLHHCGLETLGDLTAIPRKELGHRFGNALLHYLDQLWGHTADPQPLCTPPERFESCIDFAEPIRNLNWINQQIDRLIADLIQFLKLRQFVCQSFVWRFFHENSRLLATVIVNLSGQQANSKIFRELSDLKFATMRINWEFSSIELSSSALMPRQLYNTDLFDPQPHQEQVKQLLDKIANKLGNHALIKVQSNEEHLPELANAQQSFTQENLAQENLVQEEGSHYLSYPQNESLKDEPLWLLEHPQHLAQSKNQPYFNGPLTIIHGPNRISSHWWSKPQSRDYFIARQRNGRLLWLFFDRISRNWYLHGLFA